MEKGETTDSAEPPGRGSCPKCGAEFPSEALPGICPKCLLQAGSDRGQAGPGFCLSVEELQARFPELEILQLIGAGGMGAVYRARQPRLDRVVALKVLTAPVGMQENFALRFEREAQVMAKLNHPNIVTIHEFGEVESSHAGAADRSLFYFIMEYVDGSDLSRLIRDRALSPEQALQIVPQICDALQFAHDQGVTHRDIKPANILLDVRGTVKVADFGLARLVGGDASPLDTDLTQTGSSMGTPMYMAPEQWQDSVATDHRADIYSLGVVFYELLTGERPHGVFEPPSRSVKIDVRLDEVVLKSMARDVERRYQRADEVSAGISAATTNDPVQVRGRGTSRPALIWLAPALAVIAGLAVFAVNQWAERRDRMAEPPPAYENDQSVAAAVAARRRAERNAELSLFARAEPGRLMAATTDPALAPVELEVAAGIDDFVQIGVFANTEGWVGLRADGSLIRSGDGVIAEGVRALVRSDGHPAGVVHAYLSDANQLHSLAPGGGPLAPLQLPAVRHIVVQLRPAGMHVHAVLENGSVRYFEWGSPGLPMPATPPQGLLDGLASAVVNRDRWLLEKLDGECRLWTPARMIDLPASIRAIGFRAGNAVVIPESGPPTLLNVNAPGPPMWQTYYPGYDRAESLLVGPNWFGFRWPDGAWRFEPGVMKKFPAVESWLKNIDGLPPAAFALLNRQHPTAEEYAKLYWIEAAQPNPDTALAAAKIAQHAANWRPGRLRGVGMRRRLSRDGGLAPLDLRATEGITDIVQIRAKHVWGIFAALRADGEVISNHWPAFDSRTGIARLGQRSGGDQNLVYIRRNGKAVSAEADRGLRIGDVPAVDRAVVDVSVAESNGLLLLDDDRAIPWGLAYHSQNYIDQERPFTSLWPMPAAQDLNNVRAISTGRGLAALVRHDGSAMAWGGDGTVPLPSVIASGIESMVVSQGAKLVALDREGGLWAWSQVTGVEAIPSRAGAVAIAGGEFRSPPLYQTEDGHWHFCFDDDDLLDQFPEVAAAFRELQGLPADAFFLSIGEQVDGEVFLLWIEPVEK